MFIEDANRIAERYYTSEILKHCKRVKQNIMENVMLNESEMRACIVVALLHDLFEDTSCPKQEVYDPIVFGAVEMLTKQKNETYIDYIKRIKQRSGVDFIGRVAWWVKLADVKDHLAQTETLTPKLRDKYLNALPYLL